MIDAYDNLNGSVQLAWKAFANADSYHVYVNGVLNQNVAAPRAVVSGLTVTSYAASAIAPTPNNSTRPQSMPPAGVVTDSATYDFLVVAVKSGVEVATVSGVKVTASPTSVMLTTPMRRPFPFPNTAPGG